MALQRVVRERARRAELTRRRRVRIHVGGARGASHAADRVPGVLSDRALLAGGGRVVVGIGVSRRALPAARRPRPRNPVPMLDLAVLARCRGVGVEVCVSCGAIGADGRAAARALPRGASRTACSRVEVVVILSLRATVLVRPSATRQGARPGRAYRVAGVATCGAGTGVLAHGALGAGRRRVGVTVRSARRALRAGNLAVVFGVSPRPARNTRCARIGVDVRLAGRAQGAAREVVRDGGAGLTAHVLVATGRPCPHENLADRLTNAAQMPAVIVRLTRLRDEARVGRGRAGDAGRARIGVEVGHAGRAQRALCHAGRGESSGCARHAPGGRVTIVIVHPHRAVHAVHRRV